ncbi:ABC transporter ATP-binding protein [Leptolinea tardivitalis]|uniref:MFS transporter n=1 Tax=Leptolinea tardivitalis TaxID=229920 RepID=A0A0P6XPZ8_9CHLR|nr:ATP-binding cassette domain-containing protein [Leptolinea tardivitalis]KPL74305.1 MFS transporter [Leptolinea tardivitalis]GAP20507.1 ABC-type multidrug transport system, ATPase component [Leptolinea tardivitalis]
MIRVKSLSKDYGSRRAVDQISFSAAKGEILGFLGPNGAGKTTTMRMLTGYMPPTSGTAEIGGFDVVENSLEVRKLVGYMPESVPLYNEMTLMEYLTYMGEFHNIPDLDDRVDEVLEKVHLDNRAGGYVGNLSKGMRQRLGLAQAILHRPEVLILDEPTIGLDPAQIIEVRNLIREIGKEHTVMLSTHILTEVQQVCNRVIIINKGHIVAEDTPSGLQARLTGADRVNIKIKGEASELLPLITPLPGVMNVEAKKENELEVSMSAGQDIRPEIARLIVKNGFDLLEMQAASLSLEDIFMQLTQDEPARPSLDGTVDA